MKRNTALVTSVGVALGLLGGCGGSDNGPPVASGTSGSSGSSGSSAPGGPTATQQSLNTQGVLAQAQKTSETASPYVVDDGLLMLTDTSDTTAPISINANGT